MEVGGEVGEGGFGGVRCGLHHGVDEVRSSLDESGLFFVAEAGRVGFGAVAPVVADYFVVSERMGRHDR